MSVHGIQKEANKLREVVSVVKSLDVRDGVVAATDRLVELLESEAVDASEVNGDTAEELVDVLVCVA